MSVTTGIRSAFRAELAPPWWVPSALLTLAIAAALILAPYPPLQDFAEWAYQGALLARLALPGDLPGAEVWLVAHPVPNSLAQALLGLLSLLLPATLAARVFLLGLLGAGLAVALALARQRQPAAAGAFAVVLLVSVFCNATFWNGYVITSWRCCSSPPGPCCPRHGGRRPGRSSASGWQFSSPMPRSSPPSASWSGRVGCSATGSARRCSGSGR